MALPLDALRELVGPEHVLTSEHDLVAYSTDATPLQRARPEAVVLAGSRDEIAGVLRLAEEHRFPVTPRASGTNLSGGAVPLSGGVVLSCARMRKLIEIDEQNLTATCEPGLQNALLQEAVAAKGLFYPPDPGSQVISTIGGNVMECSGGLRGLKYGITRDYVMGMEAVLMGGRTFRVGGKLTKDVAGYDLVRLLVGSEGTLAVLTRDHAQAAAGARGQGHRARPTSATSRHPRARSAASSRTASCPPRSSSSTRRRCASSTRAPTSGCPRTPARC